MIKDVKGEKNNRWKGNSAGYQSKHQFLVRNFGSPSYCENCFTEGYKEKGGRWSIHYAKKHNKEYTHNRENYLGLCRKCHGIYDLDDKKIERLRNLSKTQSEEQLKKLGIKRSFIAMNRQRDKNGKFISIHKK